jgi:signal transduction histidine kinase
VTEPARADSGLLLLRSLQRPWQLVLIDLLMAVTITPVTVYATVNNAPALSSATVVLMWLVALAVSVPLTIRRQWPIAVFSVVLASAIVATLLGMFVTGPVLAVAVALYPVAVSVGPRRSAVALGAALLGVALASVLTATVLYPHFLVIAPNTRSFNTDLVSSLGFAWFTIGLGWALGRRLRARREYDSQIAEHRARQAVSEERLRIAREMHDVVAHSIGVIVMKAAVANHVYDTRPQESREALGVIESVGRAALTDIQRVLGSLRSAEDADLAPSPDLGELPKLIENARLADVEVELDRGIIPALPAAVQLSAYRIVQEALTNIIKHAVAPARCTIRITAESGELHLAVIDDGTPCRPVGEPGHGLIGMRERAALHHGTLVAGWQPHGGFAVHARLPFQV